MPVYRDKNNNLHSTKQSLNEANTKIDADHTLKTLFMQDDVSRQTTLEAITVEHVNTLARFVLMRDKQKKAATDAVVKKEGF